MLFNREKAEIPWLNRLCKRPFQRLMFYLSIHPVAQLVRAAHEVGLRNAVDVGQFTNNHEGFGAGNEIQSCSQRAIGEKRRAQRVCRSFGSG
jgi:hypothetical protein